MNDVFVRDVGRKNGKISDQFFQKFSVVLNIEFIDLFFKCASALSEFQH